MRLTIAQLEAFFWIARLGSVRIAAQQLHLTQPTLSLRVRDLERAIGAKLFERVGRNLKLTDDGEALVAHAKTVLGEVALIGERIGSSKTVSGTLRVGVPETFALVCLPALLHALRADYPALRVELMVATSFELERDVCEDRLDLAFTVNPTGDPRLRLIPLGVQQTTWAAAPSWGLGPKVRPADLVQVPIITNPHPSAMYRQISNWFRTAGTEPAQLDVCNSVTVIAQLTAVGVTVGFLPRKMIEPQILAGTIRPLAAKPAVEAARVYAAYRAADANGSIDAVVRTVRQVLERVDFLERF